MEAMILTENRCEKEDRNAPSIQTSESGVPCRRGNTSPHETTSQKNSHPNAQNGHGALVVFSDMPAMANQKATNTIDEITRFLSPKSRFMVAVRRGKNKNPKSSSKRKLKTFHGEI
jgi:hypothetical protein